LQEITNNNPHISNPLINEESEFDNNDISNNNAPPIIPDDKRDFIVGLLNVLRKLPISVETLRDIKIGKNVQMLKKMFEKDKNSPIGTKAMLIVNKWRGMIIEYKLQKNPGSFVPEPQQTFS